ncbi:MAG: hypothetical protein HMLKMBBP_00741 [Planctomycetes bacterium]|nr:hypothetical protein [Planctomycetota bacterium]
MRANGSAVIVRFVAALHALLLLAASALAQEDGSIAPHSGWSVEGGCAARTSASRERPLRGPVAVAWTAAGLPGPAVGEPLCSGPFALVECTGGPGVRWIAVIRLADGAVVAKRSFKTDAPLQPTFEGGLATMRVAPKKVATIRFRNNALTDVWSVDVPDRVAGAIAFGREVYVTSPAGVLRYDIGSPKPTWIHAEPASGRPALRGRHVYAVFPKGRTAELSALVREQGHASARISIHSVAQDDSARISVLDGTVVVQHGMEFPRSESIAGNTTKVRRKVARDTDAIALMEPVTSHVLGRPVVMGTRWAAVMCWLETTQLVISEEDGTDTEFLADRSTHPEWVQPLDGASQARGVLYANGRAFDTWSRRVLWSVPGTDGAGVWVPAGRLLLHRTRDGRVVAWRDRDVAGAAPTEISGGIPAAAVGGAVVLHDGTTILGRIRRDGADVVVVPATVPATAPGAAPGAAPPAEQRLPLASVAYAEDDAARVLLAPARADLWEAVYSVVKERAAAAWTRLLRDAMASRDPERLSRIHGGALLAGAADAELTQIDARIRMLRRENRGGGDDAVVAAKLDKSLEAIGEANRRQYLDRALSVPDDASGLALCDLLLGFFMTGEDDAAARQRVLGLLPAEFRPSGDFDPVEWLELAATLRTMPVKIVLPPKKDGPDVTHAMRQVGIAQHRWRKDVLGVETPYMVVVSPVSGPAEMARCVATGEIVVKNLEEMFALGSRTRVKGPLVTLLFHDYADYAKHAAARGYRPSRDRGADTDYLPAEEEIFACLPPGTANTFVLSEYAAVVAQQWMAERCPSIGHGAVWEAQSFEGYWAAIGLYGAVSQMRFDLGARTWSQDPEAFSLDVVASLPEAELVPWADLAAMRGAQHRALDAKTGRRFVSRTRLEVPQVLSRSTVAWSQSTAMVMYMLDAEGGALRRKYADYLVACHEGRPPEFRSHFGMTAAALGAKVVEYARRSVGADAPK